MLFIVLYKLLGVLFHMLCIMEALLYVLREYGKSEGTMIGREREMEVISKRGRKIKRREE